MEETRKNESDINNEKLNNTESAGVDARPLGKPAENIPENAPAADPDPETQLGSNSAPPASMIPEDTPQIPWIKEDGAVPEINLPGERRPLPEIGLPPKPHGPQKTDTAEDQPPSSTYRWDYSGESRHIDQKRRLNTGVLTFAIIMTIAFALCFTTLLGVIFFESGQIVIGGNRTIFVREYDSESGILTIPEIFAKVSPSVVGITVGFDGMSGSGVGTGIIMSADGYIATNYHVIEGGNRIIVSLSGGGDYEAEVIGYDEMADLAVLKINAKNLNKADFGDSDDLIVGELAVAIGNPAGLDYAETITDGIISAINRNVKIYDSTGVLTKKMTLIQTNTTVNRGNSGGPLINEYGEVIGVITMKLADDYEGMGFAIPINGALAILNEIIETGSSSGSSHIIAQKRAIIGITAGGIEAGGSYTLDDGTTGTANIAGVIITATDSKYDASNKLRPGDIITKVDGKDVYTVYDVMDVIDNKYAGDSVEVTYYRGGAYYNVSVLLGASE